ncbi:hypothetical protein CBL_04657 [Carabus blaptoides fortunei]
MNVCEHEPRTSDTPTNYRERSSFREPSFVLHRCEYINVRPPRTLSIIIIAGQVQWRTRGYFESSEQGSEYSPFVYSLEPNNNNITFVTKHLRPRHQQYLYSGCTEYVWHTTETSQYDLE